MAEKPVTRFPPCLLPRTAVCTLFFSVDNLYVVSGIGHYIEFHRDVEESLRLPAHICRQNLLKIFEDGQEIIQITVLKGPKLLVVSRCLKYVILDKLEALIADLGSERAVTPHTKVIEWVPNLARCHDLPLNAQFVVNGDELNLCGPTSYILSNFQSKKPKVDDFTILPYEPGDTRVNIACVYSHGCAFHIQGSNTITYYSWEGAKKTEFPWQPTKPGSIEGWDMILFEDQLLMATNDKLVYFNVKNGRRHEVKIYDDEGDDRVPNRRLTYSGGQHLVNGVYTPVALYFVSVNDVLLQYVVESDKLVFARMLSPGVGRIHSCDCRVNYCKPIGGTYGGLAAVMPTQQVPRKWLEYEVVNPEKSLFDQEPRPDEERPGPFTSYAEGMDAFFTKDSKHPHPQIERLMHYNPRQGSYLFEVRGHVVMGATDAEKKLQLIKHPSTPIEPGLTYSLPTILFFDKKQIAKEALDENPCMLAWGVKDGNFVIKFLDQRGRKLGIKDPDNVDYIVDEAWGRRAKDIKSICLVTEKSQHLIIAWSQGFLHATPCEDRGLIFEDTVQVIGKNEFHRHSKVVDLAYKPMEQVLMLLLGNATLVTYKCLVRNGKLEVVPMRWQKIEQMFRAEAFVSWQLLGGDVVFGYGRGLNPFSRSAISIVLYDLVHQRVLFASVKDYQKTFDAVRRFFGLTVGMHEIQCVVLTHFGANDQITATFCEVMHDSPPFQRSMVEHQVRKMVSIHVEKCGLTVIAAIGSQATILVYDPTTETIVNANQHTWAPVYYDVALFPAELKTFKGRPAILITMVLLSSEGFERLELLVRGGKTKIGSGAKAKVLYLPRVMIQQRVCHQTLLISDNLKNMQICAGPLQPERGALQLFFCEKRLEGVETVFYAGIIAFGVGKNTQQATITGSRKTKSSGNHIASRTQIYFHGGLMRGVGIIQDHRDPANGKLSEKVAYWRLSGDKLPFEFEENGWVDGRYSFGDTQVTVYDEKREFDISKVNHFAQLPVGPASGKGNLHILYRRPNEYCWIPMQHEIAATGDFMERSYQSFKTKHRSDKRPIRLHKKFGVDKVVQLFENNALAYGPDALHVMRLCSCIKSQDKK